MTIDALEIMTIDALEIMTIDALEIMTIDALEIMTIDALEIMTIDALSLGPLQFTEKPQRFLTVHRSPLTVHRGNSVGVAVGGCGVVWFGQVASSSTLTLRSSQLAT